MKITKRKQNYLSNSNLLAEFEKSIKINDMTKDFCQMMNMLTTKISESSNFARYTYIEDMKSHAMVNLARNWRKFDPQTTNSIFSFYTTCILSSFYQILNNEKLHRNIRDELLLTKGDNASFSYMESDDYNGPSDDYSEISYNNHEDNYDSEREISVEKENGKTKELGTAKIKSITKIESQENCYNYTIVHNENEINGTTYGSLEDVTNYLNEMINKIHERQTDKNWLKKAKIKKSKSK